MFKSIDLQKKLIKERDKNIQTHKVIDWVESILNDISSPNK